MNLPGVLINIDFEKAFDSLNWNFSIAVLDYLTQMCPVAQLIMASPQNISG